MNLEITLSVPYCHVAGALVSGLETGIRYWGKLKSHSAFPLDLGGWLVIKELDGGTATRLDGEAIKRGLKLLGELTPERFAHIMRGQYDALDGDCLIQCCCFGELRYG